MSGGIAAYKVCEVLRSLTESGHEVTVVPTEAALRFVGEPTWAALSGRPVATAVWDDVHAVPHVRLGQQADLVLVAPATADLLARAAHGVADDLLTSTLLTARCPVMFVPAMHTEMWEHAATQANVATLRSRGAVVVEPAIGRLTGADSGKGRLPEPDEIVELARRLIARGEEGALGQDLLGLHVVISAGGTREHLDPVRFLGNRSSGRQGWALARTALARGAHVTVVAGNVLLPEPAGARLIRVEDTEQMRGAVLAAAADADVVVMAAAVADFRPATYELSKIKKPDAPELVSTGVTLELERTPDVLAEVVAQRKPGQIVVGFAAETGDDGGDVLDYGRRKLARKGCDLMVVNEVGDGMGFEVPDNAATILGSDGTELHVPLGPKAALADAIWDAALVRLPGGPR